MDFIKNVLWQENRKLAGGRIDTLNNQNLPEILKE